MLQGNVLYDNKLDFQKIVSIESQIFFSFFVHVTSNNEYSHDFDFFCVILILINFSVVSLFMINGVGGCWCPISFRIY